MGLGKWAQARAQKELMANLALLQGGARPPEGEDDAAHDDMWVPPEGQKGDGRSRLNDLLGY